MNNIQKYIPVKGKSFRQKAYKFIFWQLIALSVVTNLFLAKQVYNFKCSEGGYFVTKAKCAEIASNKFDSQELARIHFVNNNYEN